MSAFTISRYPVVRQKRIEVGGRHKAPTRFNRFLGRISTTFTPTATPSETIKTVAEDIPPVITQREQIAAEAAQVKQMAPSEKLRRGAARRKLREERLPEVAVPTSQKVQEVTSVLRSDDAEENPTGLPTRVRSVPTGFEQLGAEEASAEVPYRPSHRAEYSEEEPMLPGRHRAILHRLGRHALNIPDIDANQVHEAALPADSYEPQHRV